MGQISTWLSVALLAVCSGASAQTTVPASQPASQPSNGLAMTDSEIHARLEALNSRGSPTMPAFNAGEDLAWRREVYLQNEQSRLNQAAADRARNQAAILAAERELPLIQAQLPLLMAQASQANQALQSLIQARDNAIHDAVNSSTGTFQGQAIDPQTGETIDVTAQVSDPGAARIETQLITAQYTPQIQSAQQQADRLNQHVAALQQRAQALTNARQSAIRDNARVGNLTSEASGAILRAVSATTEPSTSR
jgi:chromosome segregation ATPase